MGHDSTRPGGNGRASDARSAPPPPPLAQAKLAAPRRGAETLSRPRLVRRFEAGDAARLTLVSAPPGFGKTTAVREWCAAREPALAWVTADAGDNDPIRLWTYIATALDRVREGLGRSALQTLAATEASPETAVAHLTNGIAAFGAEVVLVIDDFQAVADPDCVASVERFIELLPSNGRLVLITRFDPPLPLGRLRASGDLAEVRAAHLQFTEAEVEALLVDRGSLELSAEEIEVLHARTEGWPAAIVLAGIWLRTVDDPGRSVRQFGGDHRFVAELLSHEVLDALDEEVRSFLLRASVLGRFTAELCDAVLDRSDSTVRLGQLERANLFVTRLEHDGWYRIHPLFAEYAVHHLASVEPQAPTAIRRRAAAWLHSRGLVVEAAEYAAAAGDLELVARLLVEHHLVLIRGGRTRTLLHWVDSLPDDELLRHPELAVAAATAAAMNGHRTLARRRYLALADQARTVRRDRLAPYVEAVAAMVRAASLDGGVEQAVASGLRAVELAEGGADDVLVAAHGAYAHALYFAGDLDGAWRAALRGVEHPDARRRAPGHAFARTTLALVAAERGRLETARAHADHAKAILLGVGSSRSWLGANASAALGTVLVQEGLLPDAEREFAAAERFLREEVATLHHVWLLVLLARVRVRRGRLDDAQRTLAVARGEMDELADAGALEKLAADVDAELVRASTNARGDAAVERPTGAELAVLRLLASELTTRQIGAELFLSSNTVRSHTRALYRKLGVHTRADAVARADAHGLLLERESSR